MQVGARDFYTPAEIAERYGVKDSKILAWISSGELLAINTATRAKGRPRWRISSSSLQAFEELRASKTAVNRKGRRRKSSRQVPADPNFVEYIR